MKTTSAVITGIVLFALWMTLLLGIGSVSKNLEDIKTDTVARWAGLAASHHYSEMTRAQCHKLGGTYLRAEGVCMKIEALPLY